MTDITHVETLTSTPIEAVMAAHGAPANDTVNVRLVIASIAAIAMTLIICVTILTMAGWVAPDWMGNAAIAAVGVLGGLLASTSSKRT